ncbi:hypothetical protein [Halarcobacter bivalviorum]|uniref:hypothetical protein n=1 Tax=Halarcobacter bivalviorum TaxID=663364 RepID=UPI00100AB086|nr:hypothetical protein [Halarcobacter bivalviorum]RXK05097.1 hypothetical protein CRU97_09540 [Halarcobacter bivalviorum]
MIKKKLFLFFILIFFVNLNAKEILFLGNPYSKYYKDNENIYARNIWDMQLFEGKIYLGAGNSSNIGPAQNAGKVTIISFNPKTEKFEYEYEVAEEQIDIFKVYNNRLYVPGHDATQKWTYGNIYKKEKDKWEKYRTLPNALHVYDLVEKDEQLFTSIGLLGNSAVLISDLTASKWKEVLHGRGRVYSFMLLDDKLFAIKTFKKQVPTELSITQWIKEKDIFSSRFDLNVNRMFPNTKLEKKMIKIIKTTTLKSGNLYIGAYTHNDHQNLPFGLYFISNDLLINKIELKKDEIPRDIIVRENKVYLLVSNKDKNIIYTLEFKNDNYKTSKILSFSYKTFARSFEKYDNCFYFGMGSEIKNPKKWDLKELKIETGDILKVCND